MIPNIFFGLNVPIVIIEHPTGIKYHGQVGGVTCSHPSIEGFLLPLNFQNWSYLEELSCEGCCMNSPIDEQTKEILLKNWPSQEGSEYRILLDEDRLSAGTEAWFPIKIVEGRELREYEDKTERDFLVGKKGFLLMPDNCD